MDLNRYFKKNIETDKELSHLNMFEDKARSTSLHHDLSFLLENHGGSVTNSGLFRIHTWGSSLYWTKISCNFFAAAPKTLYVYGFDWMGRNYAVDLANSNMLFMLDYAVGEFYELEQTIEGFLNEDLVDFQKETLGVNMFKKLPKKELKNLSFDKCFSFKIPLYLGGEDEIHNYELVDMEVCWELNYQLYTQIQDLPEGTLINNIVI
jgi:hypothetical protein